ncbi:MAG TPA: hypothetical protein P5572_03560 [Phycisphaerae bacterium]|nr:hypothetical protein [Phycisphaerales bacterium]HRX84076.1 hypothetical protein [Phycisphaerae bacterium]
MTDPGAEAETTSTDTEYVWYACYGSNLKWSRLMLYIAGGRSDWPQRTHIPCTRTDPPTANRPVLLPCSLFFAGESASWGGGGVAYITDPFGRHPTSPAGDPTQAETAAPITGCDVTPRRSALAGRPLCYARMYRMHRDQFLHTFAQENGRTVEDYPNGLPYAAAEAHGSVDVEPPGDYARLIHVGDTTHDGQREPVYTFTSAQPPAEQDPGEPYVRTIIEGLLDTYPYHSADGTIEYLRTCLPQHSAWTDARLKVLITAARQKWLGDDGHSGTWFQVQPTVNRDAAKRDFIVQLPRHICKGNRIAHRQLVMLVRPSVALARLHKGRRSVVERASNAECQVVQTVATVDCTHAPADDPPVNTGADGNRHAIAVDQKLRDALGIRVGGWVRVEAPHKRRKGLGPDAGDDNHQTRRSRLYRLVERILGSQPELMRVHLATFEDMEIHICRVPETTFDVLGIGHGDPVRIESPRRHLAVRAARLGADTWKTRQELYDDETWVNGTAADFLELWRLPEYSRRKDLPPILLDEERRSKLAVSPYDVVRVTRHAYRSLTLRLYVVIIPALLAALPFLVGALSESEKGHVGTHVLWTILVFVAVFVSLGSIAVLDLRNRIS